MGLPTQASDRKTHPVATGVIDYFPDAIAEVAHVSFVGNDQHNPGAPLHWDRTKSTDEADALMRHFIERGTRDVDGLRHTAKIAWRALAMLQKEIEGEHKPGVSLKVVSFAAPRHPCSGICPKFEPAMICCGVGPANWHRDPGDETEPTAAALGVLA